MPIRLSAFALAFVLICTGCNSDIGSGGPSGDSNTPAPGDPAVCSGAPQCDDGVFCNGAEMCTAGRCAAGTPPCTMTSCSEAADRCEPVTSDLPVGIPTPSFGWQLDTGAAATLFVDNTNAACDNDGSGSATAPYCDLFQGSQAVTYSAGDVVHLLGGPYPIGGDYTLTSAGTGEAPVIIKGAGTGRVLFEGDGTRADFTWQGSYGVVENLDFFRQTRHHVDGEHLVLRNIAVHNPPGAFIDFNPVVNVGGNDILIEKSEIFNNRRDNDTDSHGIQAGSGSFNVWILDNELYNNNGDSFQGCHQCFATPPHHVYIGRNVMHDDRENGIDLKTIHDVVISENVLYGYGSSSTSNGDAMVIGSNGYDQALGQGPRRVWVLNNEFRDSSTGVRIEGSQDVWIVGNVFSNLALGLQIDAKPHRVVVFASNTLQNIGGDGINIWSCTPSELLVINNIMDAITDRHVDVQECGPSVLTIDNNLLSGGLSVRADNTQHNDASGLNGVAFAGGNIDANPIFEGTTLVPAAASDAVDAGIDLDAYYGLFNAAFGGSIAIDRAGTARPSGVGQDIGAYERLP